MSKAEWKAAKAAVVAIEKERDELTKAAVAPTDERYHAALDALEQIEDTSPERLGVCEGCSDPVWEGDRHHCDSNNGIYLCESCAPAWAEMLTTPESFVDADGEFLTAEQAKAAVDAHIAAGGSLEDKMVSA